MAEPPAQNLSSSHIDPPTTSTTTTLEQHLSKHRDQPSHHYDDSSSSSSLPASGGGSYNASRPFNGDAPSVGASIRSGSDATIRSEEETVHLLNGSSRTSFPNPYRKKQSISSKAPGNQRVSFAEQLFGVSYDSNGSVVGSISGSVVGSSGMRRKVQRLSPNNNGSTVDGTASGDSASNIMAKRLLRFTYIKKNATILSIMALGMMIFLGGLINLSGSISDPSDIDTTLIKEDESRGLGYDNDSNNSSPGGIMDNYHAQHSVVGANAAPSANSPTIDTPQTIDWNKVPPHLRGYYSKTFGLSPAEIEKGSVIYRKEADDYEQSQFSNKEQAKAIQSIGQEAVLGFRPVTGRDYHAQGELNKELTGNTSNGGGFSGPMLGKEAFDSQEELQLGISQGSSGARGVDSEEQKRLDAQEAALVKASTAEADARKRRQDEVARLRASAGLTGSYYPEQKGASGAESENVASSGEEAQQQAADEEAKENIELARQKMKEEAEAAQHAAGVSNLLETGSSEASPPKRSGEAEAMEKMKEEIRLRNEEMAREQEKERLQAAENAKREEEAARQQELARQQAAEKAARLKLEYGQQLEEEERLKTSGSVAQQLLIKYAHIPFKEQTQPLPGEEKPNSPAQEPQQPQETPQIKQENPSQNNDLSEWRNDVNAKFHERLKADQKVDHTAPKQQEQQPPAPQQSSLLTEKPRQQEKLSEETNYRLRIANGELDFNEWRSKMKQELHNRLQAERAKNAPPQPSPDEVKNKVTQKLEEVEQAQNDVLSGKSTDLDSIVSLQKELSELLALMGGG